MKELAILLGTIGALFFGGAIHAQQAERVGVIPAVLTTGDYRDLNWQTWQAWNRWMRLASAPYVNPDLMDDVTIAFTYDLHEAMGTEAREAMAKKLKSGMVAPAIPDDGMLRVYSYMDPIWIDEYGVNWEDLQNADVDDIKSLEDIKSAFKGKSVMLISQDAHLAGLVHKGKVVSWTKGVAVNASSEELRDTP